jgi:PAS domain S-box-containing protein
MSSFRELPLSARLVILGYVILGAFGVLVRVPQMRTWSWEDVAATAGLALAAALSEQFTVAMRHRTEVENFSVTDAVWVPALILVSPSVLTLSVLLGSVAGHAYRRWAWYKVAFNASQFVVAITVAEFVYRLFDLPSSFNLMTCVACALAMSCYFAINEISVALIISRVEQMPLREVVVLPGGLNLLHAAGNLTIGMLAALVWQAGPIGLPLLIAPVVLSFFAYRGWLQNKREEEQRREGDRMRTLYEAGKALDGPLDANFDFQPFLGFVQRLVDAAGTELAVRNQAGLRIYSSESDLYQTVHTEKGGADPTAYISAPPGLATYVAAVRDEANEVGVLAVHRATELSPSECALVDSLASQVSARQRNQQLFDETVEQRAHLADVIGSSSDGIFVVSGAGRVLSWNPAMEWITGYLADEVIGRRSGDVLRIPGGPRADGSPPTELVLGVVKPQDALIVRRDGSDRWIRYSSSTMPERHGSGTSHVVTARDVTAELEVEQMKRDFVATVSHELRTPLTPLKGLLQSLNQGLVEDSPEARREYDAIMLRQAERLERLISDLLDASRLDAGHLPMDAVPVELGELLEREIADASQLMAGREVRLDRPAQSVWVVADQLRLGQIITNLLSNAFKYSPEEAPVIVRLTELGDFALVSVQDGGAGIAIDDQDRVFERFYRADKGLTQTAGGFGLGLYIARRLAEAMGGGLVLSSRPGEGSTFSVSLPLLVAAPQADDPASNAIACVTPTPINTDRIPVNGYGVLTDADSQVLVQRSQ